MTAGRRALAGAAAPGPAHGGPVHRLPPRGLPDTTLAGAPLAWGLGFALHGNADLHRGYPRRVFSHSGRVSTVALGDPEYGLACVVITTGLLDPVSNARRLREVAGTAVRACRVA